MERKHRATRFALTLIAVAVLMPMILTFVYSLCAPKEMTDYMNSRSNYSDDSLMEVKVVPNQFSLSQYYKILIEDEAVLRLFCNSAMYTAAILVGQGLIIPAMAYALSRFRFPFRDTLFFGIIMLMLLPFQVTMVPNVLTLREMGLMNTVWAVILPSCFSPFYIFLLRQYMVGLPGEILEAAEIDGAGTVRCFFHIILPVCKPIIGCAVALSFADSWNMVEQPLAYLAESRNLQPLSVMFNQFSAQPTGVEFAGATLYILPALFIYLYFQKDILDGIQLSELK